MYLNLRSLLLITILIMLSTFVSSCKIWSTAHLTPEVSGTVIDLAKAAPAEGFQVKFPDYDQTVKTDSAGFFKLEAITETRFFTMILPGSSVRYTPVAVYLDEQVVAWGWAVNYHWVNPEAKIYIFIPPNYEEQDLNSEASPKLAYLIELSTYLQEEEHQEKIIGLIAREHLEMMHFTEAWPANADYLGQENGLSYSEIEVIIKPFLELRDRLHRR